MVLDRVVAQENKDIIRKSGQPVRIIGRIETVTIPLKPSLDRRITPSDECVKVYLREKYSGKEDKLVYRITKVNEAVVSFEILEYQKL